MNGLIYTNYHNRKTNSENLIELRKKVSHVDQRYLLIGLNLVLTSLEIKNSQVVYDQRRETTLRLGNAIRVAEGLENVLLSIIPETTPKDVITALDMKIDDFKRIQTTKVIERNHLMIQPLYEIGVIFYHKRSNLSSYQELGKKVEESMFVEKAIKEGLSELEKINRNLKHADKTLYNSLIPNLDRLKAKLFSKEETVMRRQLVKLLGFELD